MVEHATIPKVRRLIKSEPHLQELAHGGLPPKNPLLSSHLEMAQVPQVPLDDEIVWVADRRDDDFSTGESVSGNLSHLIESGVDLDAVSLVVSRKGTRDFPECLFDPGLVRERRGEVDELAR